MFPVDVVIEELLVELFVSSVKRFEAKLSNRKIIKEHLLFCSGCSDQQCMISEEKMYRMTVVYVKV